MRPDTSGQPADSGWVDVTLSAGALVVSVEAANAGLERLRSECAAVAAGAGAIECDDYRIVYPLVGVTRLARERGLSLVYNSVTDRHQAVVGARVTLPQGTAVDSVVARLLVDSVEVASKTYTGLEAAGVPVRLAFGRDGGTSGSGLVPVTVKVTAHKTGGGTLVGEAEGHYLAIDRSKEFGRGWWPVGYERIVPAASPDTIVWIGGDGTARAYARGEANGPFVGVSRARADTIVELASGGGGTTAGGFLDLDGNERGIRAAGTHTGLMGVNRLTWAWWMKPAGQSGRIGGVYATGDPNRVWWFEADNSGTELQVALFNTQAGGGAGEPIVRTTTGGSFATGQWAFVVVEFDGTQGVASNRLKVWVNGVQRTLVRPVWSPDFDLPAVLATSGVSPFEWGSLSQFAGGFVGQLGELAIVSAPLGANERSAWQTGGIDFDRPGRVVGYKFAGTLEDEVGSQDFTSFGIDGADYGTTADYPSRAAVVASGYERRVLGGGRTEFDETGRHTRTVDPNGNETVFTHVTVAGAETRLSQVQLPTPSGPEAAYEFLWDGASGRLTALTALGGAGTWLTYPVTTTAVSGGFRIDGITTPDGLVTSFGYAGGVGPLTEVTDARGAKTLVSYAHQKVSAVRVVTPAEPQIADIVMPYQAAETRGVETVPGAFGPARADSVGSVFDGPLAGPADTVRFFTLGWGGVRARRDALGNAARAEREDPGFPALVTRTVEANGHAVSRTYTGAGLLASATDETLGGTPTFTWDAGLAVPLSATSPEGVARSWTYDAVGNRLTATDGGGTTTFRYTPLGQVEEIAEANGAVIAFAYDAAKGNLASVVSPLGHRTSWVRDAAGRPVKTSEQVTASDTTLAQTFYDVMGRDTLRLRTSSGGS